MNPITVPAALSMDAAEQALHAALADEGFAILTQIDLAGTIKKKIGVERTPLKTFGACNPHLANRALDYKGNMAVFMPCHIAIAETPGGTVLTTADPMELFGSDLAEFAVEVGQKLRAALEAVAASA